MSLKMHYVLSPQHRKTQQSGFLAASSSIAWPEPHPFSSGMSLLFPSVHLMFLFCSFSHSLASLSPFLLGCSFSRQQRQLNCLLPPLAFFQSHSCSDGELHVTNTAILHSSRAKSFSLIPVLEMELEKAICISRLVHWKWIRQCSHEPFLWQGCKGCKSQLVGGIKQLKAPTSANGITRSRRRDLSTQLEACKYLHKKATSKYIYCLFSFCANFSKALPIQNFTDNHFYTHQSALARLNPLKTH